MRNLALIISILLTGCSGLFGPDQEDPVVARANEKYLLASELAQKIPGGLSGRDSATLAQNYISKWIQQEILLQKAREMLTPDEQDFTKQMQEYRNSLMLFTLEQKLVEQYLDTAVSDEEIIAYFENNRTQFELKGNIVKFDFVKVVKKSRKLKDFRRLIKSGNPEDFTALESLATQHATDYWFAREWIAMNTLLDEIPIEVENQELFLRRTASTEAEDSLYIYLLRINDYKTTDSIPPLEFEKGKIRNIIINSRKLNLIDSKREEIIEQAFRDDRAEVF